jgi:hypothetical protein
MSDDKTPPWAPEQMDQSTLQSLSNSDDRPRKLVRGRLLKISEDCRNNRHKQRCSSSHYNCKCHAR